jgi:hypothetical protein
MVLHTRNGGRAAWVFDALPPSGARRGGDPSEHVFKHELDTFIREVVQNANDQRAGNPTVDFTAKEYEGSTLDDFLTHLHFDELKAHLSRVGPTRTGRRIRQRLETLEQTARLRVLRIEDRNTVGLTGHEHDGDSHFRALCKDVLFSHKATGNAGGSFGLGKSVLWTFSGWSTVVFNSVPREVPGPERPPRLIGRAELPSHDRFAGPGWFGIKTATEAGERAESAWGLTASTISHELGIRREQLDTGTTILILDFREPAADRDPSSTELHDQIRRAAARWFWPAMCFSDRPLTVSTAGTRVHPDEDAEVAPFVKCFAGRRSTRTQLEEPGDVVARDVEVELPGRPGGQRPVIGRVRLVVRLAEDAGHPRVGQIALFRGAGMVVRYLDRSSLATQHRPFHAILCCGEARDLEAATDEDRLMEAFLRDAEPPGHDEWEATPALKETWNRGYAKALETLKSRLTQALKDLIAPAPTVGTRGPELLQKRFPFGARGTPGSAPTSFSFSNLKAGLHDGRWSFSGELAPTRGRGAWLAEIRLREVNDEGSVLREVPIAHLVSGRPDAEVTTVDGMGRIHVKQGLAQLHFSGTSVVLDGKGSVGALSLEVTGRRQ